MVDQVCSLQAHGVCAVILNSGNTWVSKALLATERDIAQGKLIIIIIITMLYNTGGGSKR